MSHLFITRLGATLAIAATLLLPGCGGGGAAGTLLAEVGSGGTGGTVLGILTGFGSLIVDGVRRDDSLASYMSEEDQGSAMAMASTGVMLGHSLELNTTASSSITSVMVSPELLGIVTGVAANGLTVLGTNVVINHDTALGPVTALLGYSSPTAIQIGDRVAIYGLLKTDAQGAASVQASLIALKPAGTGVRLTGYVAQYNPDAGTFAIGSNTVAIGAAAISPAGGALANGELVTVWSNSAPVGATLTAATIRIKTLTGTSNLTLSGVISSFASQASFKIRNVTIDAGSATITPSGATLSDNKYAIVAGKYDSGANRLTATTVAVYAPAAAAAVELHGTILNFVSPSSFTVRGVVVDASAATVTGGTLPQLANNVFVEVNGAVTNSEVKATSVQIVSLNPLNAPNGAMLDLAGTINSFDAATGRYTMTLASGAAVSGTMGSGMFFNNGTASNLMAGQAVSVRGMMNDNQLSTSVVNFAQTTPPMPGPGIAHMEGIISNVTATSFMLNGLTIQSNGIAIRSGGMMGGGAMMSGMRVGVDVQYSAGQYLATAIQLLNG